MSNLETKICQNKKVEENTSILIMYCHHHEHHHHQFPPPPPVQQFAQSSKGSCQVEVEIVLPLTLFCLLLSVTLVSDIGEIEG